MRLGELSSIEFDGRDDRLGLMRLSAIIRAEKSNVSHGRWSEDKTRAKDFPLSKKRGKAYPLTRRWRWRASTLDACEKKFRLLTAYHMLVPEFSAVLAEDLSGDSRIVARLEFHGTHGGWHAHAKCGDVLSVPSGIVKPAGIVRLPKGGAFHRHCEMLRSGKAMSDVAAAAIVADFFRIPDEPDLFSVGDLPW